jgi:S-DNA-T family DNA segregation ATPase FtsK/SpoIIIE
VVFVFAALLLAAFIDFSPNQTKLISARSHDPHGSANIFGDFGANFVFFAMRYFGFAAWLLPFCLFMVAGMLFRSETKPLNAGRIVAITAMLIGASGFLEYVQGRYMSTDEFLKFSANKFSVGLGGTVGYFAFRYVAERIFASVGSAILMFTIFAIAAQYVFIKGTSLDLVLERKMRQHGHFGLVVFRGIKLFFLSTYAALMWIPRKISSLVSWIFAKTFYKKTEKIVKNSKINGMETGAQKGEKNTANTREYAKDYTFPSIELLQRAKRISSDDDHSAVSRQLVDTLAQFGITVHPGEVHVGPVITRYEILPAPGVRVEKIVSLDKNIALNLCAQSVRVLAPVPGRGCVGVELPNRNPQMVCLREILESQDWLATKSDIPMVLGRGTTGEPIINDLAKMPHLLIAGATGSGKTVCINAIIASLVYHSTPNDLRFIMVDPKIIEMQVFNRLPHMLIPVVTDPKKVPNALKWLISEMELRYKIFAKVGVRNIAGFNAKMLKNSKGVARAEKLDRSLSQEERLAGISTVPRTSENIAIPNKKIPYIVCIIDELADLMMVASADVETCVARLAQLARAAGIHLILATQRPSVNVITGVIKANLPSRIAFKVASKVDSRIILDAGGAESLLGRGDMLFRPPEASALLRAQGALVSDDEINKIVDSMCAKNGKPIYATDVQTMVECGEDRDGSSNESLEDDVMQRALEVIRSGDRVSISLLQRKLKIGYTRAARIMEVLEARGLIGKQSEQQKKDGT